MTTYSNLKYDHPFSSNATGTGSLTFISKQTASSSASISFTGIDSTYKEYVFYFNNIHPSVDSARFDFNLSTDNGSNYNVTKTSSFFYSYHNEADTDYALSYQTARDLAQSTSYQTLGYEIGADNDQSASGYLHLFNPSSTTYVKHFISTINNYYYDDYSQNTFIAGYGNTTSAIDAIDFKMSSGNIDAGTISLFGVN